MLKSFRILIIKFKKKNQNNNTRLRKGVCNRFARFHQLNMLLTRVIKSIQSRCHFLRNAKHVGNWVLKKRVGGKFGNKGKGRLDGE